MFGGFNLIIVSQFDCVVVIFIESRVNYLSLYICCIGKEILLTSQRKPLFRNKTGVLRIYFKLRKQKRFKKRIKIMMQSIIAWR